MTKNEDVSWIPKPVGCSLKRFTTAELKNCQFCYCGATAKQWNKRYTTHICPQFGVIGAVCSDPENLCDQYVFCKRARELQKEPDTLPQWAIEAIEIKLQSLHSKVIDPNISNTYELGGFQALKWVLSLRKQEVKE